MTQKNIPSNAELIKQTLNTRRYSASNLFSPSENTPYFWKLSDLSILYPNFFDVHTPISQYTCNKLANIITRTIPEFHNLPEQPVHILTTKETYNIYLKQNNKIKTVKNAPNQHLTNVACEYLFGQLNGAELEQACFLYPDKDAHELTIKAAELKFEHRRNQVARTSNLLSAIINHAHGANKNSFREIWSLIWQTLYNVKTMDVLRNEHNVKTSPIDYMKPQTLRFVDAMLQEIALNFATRTDYSIDEVRYVAKTKASFARKEFLNYGSTPEKQLLKQNSYHIIERTRKARKKFWRENYLLSLKVR